MIQEVRQALLLQRLQYGPEKVSHRHVLNMATEESARCLGRNDIGSIEPGKQADLALFRLDKLRFSGAGDPLAALILCGADSADHVMVDGQWRVKDKEIVGIDLMKLKTQHHQLAMKLQQQI